MDVCRAARPFRRSNATERSEGKGRAGASRRARTRAPPERPLQPSHPSMLVVDVLPPSQRRSAGAVGIPRGLRALAGLDAGGGVPAQGVLAGGPARVRAVVV